MQYTRSKKDFKLLWNSKITHKNALSIYKLTNCSLQYVHKEISIN